MDELEQLSQARNHFEFFSMPVQFVLDQPSFERRYLQLSRLTHPDFAGNDAEAQMAAVELAARLNEAHAVLGDDLRRAEYLLALRSGPTGEQTGLDAAMLERVFAMREALERARQCGDTVAVQSIRQQATQWLGQILAEVGNRLDAQEAGEDVRHLLAAGRYVRQIDQ